MTDQCAQAIPTMETYRNDMVHSKNWCDINQQHGYLAMNRNTPHAWHNWLVDANNLRQIRTCSTAAYSHDILSAHATTELHKSTHATSWLWCSTTWQEYLITEDAHLCVSSCTWLMRGPWYQVDGWLPHELQTGAVPKTDMMQDLDCHNLTRILHKLRTRI